MGFNVTQPIERKPSPTATPGGDSFGLGRTPGQRGAEILAGFRAEKLPSPETRALSRMSGRVFARLLLNLADEESKSGFPARDLAARVAPVADLAHLRVLGLQNAPEDPVKVVYHPDNL